MSLTALVPKMTSPTTPSGVVSSNSEYPSYPGWSAFAQTFWSWITADATYPAWLAYQFASAQRVTHYSVVSHTNPAWVATEWQFQGSNSGTEWTTLDTQTGQGSSLFQMYAIPAENVGSYLHYRFNITAGSAVFCATYSLQLYTATEAQDPNTILASAGGNWNDANITPGNLLSGVVAGVDDAIVGTFDEAIRNADPGEANVLHDIAYKIQNVSKTGSLVAAGPNDILKSAGGNYDDDNLTPENVKAAVDFGIGQTGTYTGGSQFDWIYWEYDGDGNLMPRGTPLPVASKDYVREGVPHLDGVGLDELPVEADVRAPVGYGTNGTEFEGTYAGGAVFGTAARVHGRDVLDGNRATLTVSESPHPAAVNEVFVGRMLANGAQEWYSAGTVTGNGSLTYNGYPGEWQCKVQTTTATSLGVAIGNVFSITNVENMRRIRMRDRTAKAALRVAHRFGRRVYWHNPGEEAHVEVWAVCEGGFESLGLLGGETSATRFTLWIPRQIGFPPPDGFMTGAAVWVDNQPYASRVSYDAEAPEWAPVFRVDCERFDVTVELDGQTPPA